MTDYFDANRANWDDRAEVHSARDGSGYNIDRYIADRTLLSDVVRFDIPLIGEVAGLTGVHLQCHIGTDTLSLARRGAKMTGVDFSRVALANARQLVAETGDDVQFVESNVYEAASVLPAESFDFVFTGIGAIGWLPDITEWASVVRSLLKPGGFLFIRDCHPMLWTIDETRTDDLHILYSYWQNDEPLVTDDDTTYVDASRPLRATRTYEWNHGMGEIVTAVLAAGLTVDVLVEHDSVPWLALPGQMTERPDGEWALAESPKRLPMSFTLKATLPA